MALFEVLQSEIHFNCSKVLVQFTHCHYMTSAFFSQRSFAHVFHSQYANQLAWGGPLIMPTSCIIDLMSDVTIDVNSKQVQRSRGLCKDSLVTLNLRNSAVTAQGNTLT